MSDLQLTVASLLASDSPPPPPSSDDGGPQPEIVELATLALPRSAMETGLEVGEGNHVVLEASNETVEQLQQAMQSVADDGGTTVGGGTVVEERPSISAVVDLEKLSELVGATEADLITGLQQEMQENRATNNDDDEASEITMTSKPPDEETPLISNSTKIGTQAEGADEDVEVSETPIAAGTEQITLLADPFIETLVEVAPTVLDTAETTTVAGDSTIVDTLTVATTTLAVADILLGNETEDADQPEEQHFAHDAFLLDVPTTDDLGNVEHRFVLALPEIVIEESVQTAASALSHDSSFHVVERALSLLPTTIRLPTDIENVHLEATEHVPTKTDPNPVHLDVVINRRVPSIGYVILFSGLFALSSVGAALDLQQGGVSAIMKTQWRQTSTAMVLLPLVLKSLWYDDRPKLTSSEWLLLPVASAAYAYMVLAFVIALEMTTMTNAFVLSNMTSLVLILGRFVLGMPVLPLEGSGAITGFFGAAICAQDAARTMAERGGEATVSASPTNQHYGMLGNFIALSASFGTAGYLLIAKKLRPKMDLFVFMFAVMSFGSIYLFAFMIATGEAMTFDRDAVHGLFGWIDLRADRLPLELYLAIVCNCLGTTGYIAVMKYFDPLVPATVMLLEPAIGTILGVAVGTSTLPGLQTWLGNLVVAGGTFLVIYSGSSKKESIDATMALRPRTGGDIFGEDAGNRGSDSLTRSPLLPRRSPALSKSNAQTRKESFEVADGNGAVSAAKVIWEVD